MTYNSIDKELINQYNKPGGRLGAVKRLVKGAAKGVKNAVGFGGKMVKQAPTSYGKLIKGPSDYLGGKLGSMMSKGNEKRGKEAGAIADILKANREKRDKQAEEKNIASWQAGRDNRSRPGAGASVNPNRSQAIPKANPVMPSPSQGTPKGQGAKSAGIPEAKRKSILKSTIKKGFKPF